MIRSNRHDRSTSKLLLRSEAVRRLVTPDPKPDTGQSTCKNQSHDDTIPLPPYPPYPDPKPDPGKSKY